MFFRKRMRMYRLYSMPIEAKIKFELFKDKMLTQKILPLQNCIPEFIFIFCGFSR